MCYSSIFFKCTFFSPTVHPVSKAIFVIFPASLIRMEIWLASEDWLVGVIPTPLKKIWVRQLGSWNSQYMEKYSKPPTSWEGPWRIYLSSVWIIFNSPLSFSWQPQADSLRSSTWLDMRHALHFLWPPPARPSIANVRLSRVSFLTYYNIV